MQTIRVSEEAAKYLKDQNKLTDIPITRIASKLILQKPFSKPTRVKKTVETIPGMREIWEQLNPDHQWNGAESKHLLELQRKLIITLGRCYDNNQICELLQVFLMKLPEWYKDKGLAILNSKYNDIIKQIKHKPYDPAEKLAREMVEQLTNPRKDNT